LIESGGEWCNGSTADSGSACLGSNPSSPAPFQATFGWPLFLRFLVASPHNFKENAAIFSTFSHHEDLRAASSTSHHHYPMLAHVPSKGAWLKPPAHKPLTGDSQCFHLTPRRRDSSLNHYLPLIIAAAALALLAGLLCRPSWRKTTIPPWAALAIGICAVAGGVGYGIVHTLGQNPEIFPRLGRYEAWSHPLRAGEKAPPLEARGWLNGTPPYIKDRNVRVTVVDVWADW
jgi:hypothetical protein